MSVKLQNFIVEKLGEITWQRLKEKGITAECRELEDPQAEIALEVCEEYREEIEEADLHFYTVHDHVCGEIHLYQQRSQFNV